MCVPSFGANVYSGRSSTHSLYFQKMLDLTQYPGLVRRIHRPTTTTTILFIYKETAQGADRCIDEIHM